MCRNRNSQPIKTVSRFYQMGKNQCWQSYLPWKCSHSHWSVCMLNYVDFLYTWIGASFMIRYSKPKFGLLYYFVYLSSYFCYFLFIYFFNLHSFYFDKSIYGFLFFFVSFIVILFWLFHFFFFIIKCFQPCKQMQFFDKWCRSWWDSS